MRRKEDLPDLYMDMDLLIEHGDGKEDLERVAYSCYEIVGDYELETTAWFLSSKAFLALNRPTDALLGIETAIKIDPSRLDFYFHLFNVLIALNRDFEIASWLNLAFPKFAANEYPSFIGYVEKCLETGIVHKMQLSVDIVSAIVKERNRTE